MEEVVHEDQVLVKLNEWVLRGFPQSSHGVDEDLSLQAAQWHRQFLPSLYNMWGGDYFSLAGMNYLVLGDRFSGWLSI